MKLTGATQKLLIFAKASDVPEGETVRLLWGLLGGVHYSVEEYKIKSHVGEYFPDAGELLAVRMEDLTVLAIPSEESVLWEVDVNDLLRYIESSYAWLTKEVTK